MKSIKLSQAFVVLLSLVLISCETEGSNGLIVENVSTTPPDSTAQQEFYHAWLADCMNDVPYTKTSDSIKAAAHFESIAKGRINKLLITQVVIDVMGTEKLVWGPALSVNNQGGNSFVSKNLMYCVKKIDSSGVTYSIGISGTNMVSPFDWMSEDLNVKKQVPWPYGGSISKGSENGFNALMNLKNPSKDSAKNTYLISFLYQELQKNPGAKINVSGHSLGGALTQVYASFLKSSIHMRGLSKNVQAWVYAGPTAGDNNFASQLTTSLDGYNSYSNIYDVIPHAWEKGKLAQLCNLYDQQPICHYKPWIGSPYYIRMKNTPGMNGVIYYLRSQSKNGNYTDPGLLKNQHTFNMGTLSYMLSTDALFKMDGGLDAIYTAGNTNDLYKHLNEISKKCNAGREIGEDDFKQFFYYMVEMGSQHTSAYFDYFFQGKPAAFKSAVKKAVPGGETDWNELMNSVEGKDILEKFLGKVADFYKSNTNCSCSAPV